MATTANLKLPLLAAAQSQKHLTVNEALVLVDALCQISLTSSTISVPPVTPSNGDTYVVAAGPTGDWTGQADMIAVALDNAWIFVTPEEGWLAYDRPTDRLRKYTGAQWEDVGATGSFTTVDSKTVTVTGGLITAIV